MSTVADSLVKFKRVQNWRSAVQLFDQGVQQVRQEARDDRYVV